MPRPKPRPTPDEHRALAPVVADLRRRLADVVDASLDRRTTAPILDAANAAAHWLHMLTLRLADDLDRPGVYRVEDPPRPPSVGPRSPRGPRRLSADEHVRLGADLHGLRDDVVTVFAWLARRYPKGSGVVRAAAKVARLLDTLRCRLDDLFYRHHPAQFTTRAYYPGTTAPPRPRRDGLPVASAAAHDSSPGCVVGGGEGDSPGEAP